MNEPNQERVDTVLAALRNVEPAAGMQARLLAGLHRAEAAVARQESHGLRPAFLPSWGWSWKSYAVAAAVVAVAAGALVRQHLQLQEHAVSRPAIAHASSVRLPYAGDASTPLTAGVPHVSQRHGISLRAAAGSHVSEARHGAPAASPDDRSFPAPPLPLTEQERLLLRLARSEPPRQLAQLSAIRNTGYERERDAVSEFFAGRPPLRGQEEPAPDVLQTGQQ